MGDLIHSKLDGSESLARKESFVKELIGKVEKNGSLAQFDDIKDIIFLLYNYFCDGAKDLIDTWFYELSTVIQGLLFSYFAVKSKEIGKAKIVASGHGYLVTQESGKAIELQQLALAVQEEWEQFVESIDGIIDTKARSFTLISKLIDYALKVYHLKIDSF